MTEKKFLHKLTGDKIDLIGGLTSMLTALKTSYCLIGGIAVNAYVQSVASLDLGMVLSLSQINSFLDEGRSIFKISTFPHSINLEYPRSDLRIQIQTDERYQPLILSVCIKEEQGYLLMVASVENVLQGKIWAFLDSERRKSKRQKDLSAIFRIVEKYPHLENRLPDFVRFYLAA